MLDGEVAIVTVFIVGPRAASSEHSLPCQMRSQRKRRSSGRPRASPLSDLQRRRIRQGPRFQFSHVLRVFKLNRVLVKAD